MVGNQPVEYDETMKRQEQNLKVMNREQQMGFCPKCPRTRSTRGPPGSVSVPPPKQTEVSSCVVPKEGLGTYSHPPTPLTGVRKVSRAATSTLPLIRMSSG